MGLVIFSGAFGVLVIRSLLKIYSVIKDTNVVLVTAVANVVCVKQGSYVALSSKTEEVEVTSVTEVKAGRVPGWAESAAVQDSRYSCTSRRGACVSQALVISSRSATVSISSKMTSTAG